MSPSICPRCGDPMTCHSCSWFTTEDVCAQCRDDERHTPNYARARAAEEAAVRAGHYNYRGIGLAPEDLTVLETLRQRRRQDPWSDLEQPGSATFWKGYTPDDDSE